MPRRIIRNRIPKLSEEATVTVEDSVPDKNEPQSAEGSTTAETSLSEPIAAPSEPLSQLSTARKRGRGYNADAPPAKEENFMDYETGNPKEVITKPMSKAPVIPLSRASRRTVSPKKVDIEVTSQEDEKSKENPAVEVKENVTEVIEAIKGKRKRGRPRTKFVSEILEKNEDIDTTSKLVDADAEKAQAETLVSESCKKLEEIDPLRDIKESEDSTMKCTKRSLNLKRNLLNSPNPIKKEPDFEAKDVTDLKMEEDVELNKELISSTLDIKKENGKETYIVPKVELPEKVSVAEVKFPLTVDGEEKMDCDFQEKKELCITGIKPEDTLGADNAVKKEVNEEAPLQSQKNLSDTPAKTTRGRRILRRAADKGKSDTPESKNSVGVANEIQSHSTKIAKHSPSGAGKEITEVEGKEIIHSPESEVSIKIEPILQERENIECDKKVRAIKVSAVKEPIEISICSRFEKGGRDDMMESPPTNQVKDIVGVTQDCKEEVPLKRVAVESSIMDTVKEVPVQTVEVQGCDISEKREIKDLTESPATENVKNVIGSRLEDKEKIPNDANKETEDIFKASDEINFDEFIEIDSYDNLDETENADEEDDCCIIDNEELNYEAADENIDDDGVSSLDPNEMLIIEDDAEYKNIFEEEIKDSEARALNKQRNGTDQEKRCKLQGEKTDEGKNQTSRNRRKSPASSSQKRLESKEKSIINQENKSGNEEADSKDHTTGNILQIHSKSDIKKGNNFRRVVILANSLYKFQLKGIENTYVKVIYEDSQNTEKIIHIIENYRKENGRNTLWILLAGVLTFMNNKEAASCKDCKDPLRIIHTKSNQTGKNLLDYILHLGSLTCDFVQDRLGSKELITIAPPLPALLAIEEHYKTHQKLHEAAKDHNLVATKFTYEHMHKRYNEFCREWTNKACDRNNSWINVEPFRKYIMSGEINLFFMSSKDRYEIRLKEWFKVMEKFINLVLETPFPSARVLRKAFPSHKMEHNEDPPQNKPETEEKFTKVVVIRNTPFTKHLQSLTKEMNVEYLEENIDFDEDGLAFLNELQKKHPSRTLYVVLSGVSEIAEPSELGPPKCKLINCNDPIPVFVIKNDKAGDPKFKDMSIDQMVNTKVKGAFSFATLAIDKLKNGSGIFLAPIMPLCAIWSGNATPHSHDAIHRMFKRDPGVPHFMGVASSWIRSAKALEMKWLDKIMSSLEKESYAYELMKTYKEERPPVLEYVEDVNVPQLKQVQTAWSKMMANMFQYYLVVSETKRMFEPVPVKTPVNVLDREMDLVPPGVNPSEAVVPLDHQAPVNYVTPNVVSNAYAPSTTPVGYTYPEAGVSMNPQFPSMGVPPHPMMVPAAYPGAYAYPAPYYSGWTTPVTPTVAAASTYVPSVPVAPVSEKSYASTYVPSVPVAPVSEKSYASPFVPSISVAPVSETSAASAGACTIQAPPKLKTAMKGHLVIENVETDMTEAQAKSLLQAFGEMGDMKWPRKQKGQPARFLMIHYNQRKHAEKAERILNYLKVFGDNAKVKLIGGDTKGETKLESEDLEMLLSIHDILDRIKKNKMNKVQQIYPQLEQNKVGPTVAETVGLPQVPASVSHIQVPAFVDPPKILASVGPLSTSVGPVQVPETPVLTIVVSNFTDIVPVKDVKEMFVELGACDQGVLIKNALHFTFKGEPAVIKVLSGFRFPDKKMEVIGKTATDELKPSHVAIREAKALIEEPLSKLLKKVGKVLKDKIDEEMNVYSFKTRLCRYADVCKTKDLCSKFHDAGDRRRCPILFRYSDEMCTELEETGSCEAKDKCSSAHSPVEILFHCKNFRSSICRGWNQNRACDKVGRVCSYLHPGKPEMLFNEKWNNVYVEGLKTTLDYLSEAIRNLFLLKDLQCVRVLLVTVSPKMAKLYVDCITDLAKTCNQKVSLLLGDALEEGTTVTIATLDALRHISNVNKPQELKRLDTNRLRALILDDGPALLKNCPKYMQSYFQELAKKDVNVVVTAEKISTVEVEDAHHKIKPRGGFKKIYAASSKEKDSKHPSSAKSGSYRNDVLERLKSSTRSGDTNSREKRSSERRRSKDRKEKMSENKRSSKERNSASNSSRASGSRSSSSKESSSSSQKSDDRIKTLATLKIKYKKTLAELEKELEQQIDLYVNSPEFHPEYEQRYSIFIEQYRNQYPNWTNTEHFDKLWEEFWKELITSLLQEEYAAKKQTIEKDFNDEKEKALKSTSIQDYKNSEKKRDEDRKERRISESQKRKSEDRDSCREKYRRVEKSFDEDRKREYQSRDEDRGKTHQLDRNEELSRDSYGMGQYHSLEENLNRYGRLQLSSDTAEFSSNRRQESNFPTDNIDESYMREAVSLLEELCPSLGVLGPAAEFLMRQISLCGSDRRELSKLVQDEDNKMILKRLSEKALGVSQIYGSGPQAMRLRLASTHALKLLNLTSVPSENQKYYGLDIVGIAKLTYNIEPSFIVQCIRNALNTKGITNASEKDVAEIYDAVTAAHFGISYTKQYQNQN
ncbi:uncharacterized protein [Palaemon carinicauda]|uniref:uncharacterized protein n=1 Tax=Palaemon carinicauda TaxID=392227 RepID=UPI0035B5E99F